MFVWTISEVIGLAFGVIVGVTMLTMYIIASSKGRKNK